MSALEQVNGQIVLYAILSLTLVRMVPVALSMIRTKVRPVTALFLGWFGPRGVASILYIFTVLEAEELAGLPIHGAVQHLCPRSDGGTLGQFVR